MIEPSKLPPPTPDPPPQFLRSVNKDLVATLIVRLDEESIEIVRTIVREELDRKPSKKVKP